MTPSALGGLGTMTAQTVDVGSQEVQLGLVSLDGTGLLSIPFGLNQMNLVTLDGTGLLSIPLGLRAGQIYGGGDDLFPMGGEGLLSIPYSLQSTPLGQQLDDGGWQVQGYSGALALGVSSQLAIAPAAASTAYGVTLGGSGAGAQLLP